MKNSDSEVSIKERREILSYPQVGNGISTLLLGRILPELVSQIEDGENWDNIVI